MAFLSAALVSPRHALSSGFDGLLLLMAASSSPNDFCTAQRTAVTVTVVLFIPSVVEEAVRP